MGKGALCCLSACGEWSKGKVMIETTDTAIDRGRWLYGNGFKKTITGYCIDRIDGYYMDEQAFKALKSRIQTMDDMVDLKFKESETFIAEIAVPVIRTSVLQLQAFTRKYFENDPLVTVRATGNTTDQSAEWVQHILNRNFVNTRFRNRCFDTNILYGARYGVYVNYSQFERDVDASGYQTAYDANDPLKYVRKKIEGRTQVANYPIHPLNYFQDPQALRWYGSCFRGFIDEWSLSSLRQCVENENYIRENVVEILDGHKKEVADDHFYSGRNAGGKAEVGDSSRRAVNVSRMWTTLCFDGNEDDPTVYYIEICDKKIIRIQENPLDYNVIPITVGTYIDRPNTWWGNTPPESNITQQNLANYLVNTQVESAMKAMDRVVLYRAGGGLDVADMNNRHSTGGYVPVTGIDPLDKLMHQMPVQNTSNQSTEYLMREIRQQVQENSPIVNLQNRYNAGGMNNDTLGAAQMIAGIGEILQGDMMKRFGNGIEELANVNGVLFQQFLGENVEVRAKSGREVHRLTKRDVIGNYEYSVESSAGIDEMKELQKASNMLTQALNFAKINPESVAGIRFEEFVQDWIKAGFGKYGDTDKYYQKPVGGIPAKQLTQAPAGQAVPAMGGI